MFKILSKKTLCASIKEMVVEVPLIARKAKPGNFILLRIDERGERVPLTIADSDADRGTLTLVFQEVGKTTTQLGAMREGDRILDVVGPLGNDRHIPPGGQTIICAAGGVGVAPIYPQAKAFRKAGNRVISVIGARTKELFFWTEKMEAISDYVEYSTDDGSFGFHGLITGILDQIIEREGKDNINEVEAIGPVPMMRAVCELTKKYPIPTTVSLNPIMLDGTGMCGGCRVTVGGKVKFTCVDGPEFDGHQVDFAELSARLATYKDVERQALDRFADATKRGEHECRLNPA